MLTKHKIILAALSLPSPWPTFTVDGDPSSMEVYYLDRGVWEEMGRPAAITVTVEPGDTLN